MTIVFLTDEYPPFGIGGSGMIVAALARGLNFKGHKVSVITTVQDERYAGQSQAEGTAIYSVFTSYNESFRAYKSLYNGVAVSQVRQIFGEIKPDIVHAHNLHQYLSYACLKAAKSIGAKVFLTAHDAMLFHYGKLAEFIDPKNPLNFGTDYHVSGWQLFKRYGLRYNPFRNLVIRRYLRYADGIFAVSHALAEALEQNSVQGATVAHNGIDPQDWVVSQEAVSACRSRFNLNGKKIILFGGRISGLKGGEQAVRALESIVRQVPNTVLLIVGKQNQYLENIQKLARNLKVDENVIATGWLSGNELKAAYTASDVIVVPSLYLDPFPTVVLEAMASKKPVVATCFGGSSEIILEGETGYIVNPYIVEELAVKIIDLLKNPARAHAFGEAGFRRVQKDFNINRTVDRYLQYYQNTA
mgnify:CR=1 FL=1